jgi:hypothetical protein
MRHTPKEPATHRRLDELILRSSHEEVEREDSYEVVGEGHAGRLDRRVGCDRSENAYGEDLPSANSRRTRPTRNTGREARRARTCGHAEDSCGGDASVGIRSSNRCRIRSAGRILSASYSEGRRRIWNGVDFSNSWNRTSCTGSSRRCARANNARTHQRDGHPRRVRNGDRDSSSESKKDVGVESQIHRMSEPWHSFLAST